MNPSLKAVESINLPSAFQPGESCLVHVGGAHLPGNIRTVSFGDDGKVRYTCWISDPHGIVEITVPSERCARSMETMLEYSPSAADIKSFG